MKPILVLLVVTFPALAQDVVKGSWDRVQAVPAGETVVITRSTGKPQKGRLQAVTPDALTLQVRDDTQQIPRLDITRIKVRSHGKRMRNAAIVAAVGAGIGLGLGGAALGLLGGSDGFGAILAACGVAGGSVGFGAGMIPPGYSTVYRVRR